MNFEEIKYCNLARAFLNESYECLLIKNLLDLDFNQKVTNILEVENFTHTKEFEVVCGASLVTVEEAKLRLNRNINSLESLLIFEAQEFLFKKFEKHIKQLRNKNVTKTRIKKYLNSEEFIRACKIANYETKDVISMYKDNNLI